MFGKAQLLRGNPEVNGRHESVIPSWPGADPGHSVLVGTKPIGQPTTKAPSPLEDRAFPHLHSTSYESHIE